MELVLEIEDPAALAGAASRRIAEDPEMSAEERGYASDAVTEDIAEALTHLVDPLDLVRGVPGVDLAQASWSAQGTEHAPDALEWDLGADDTDGTDDVEGFEDDYDDYDDYDGFPYDSDGGGRETDGHDEYDDEREEHEEEKVG